MTLMKFLQYHAEHCPMIPLKNFESLLRLLLEVEIHGVPNDQQPTSAATAVNGEGADNPHLTLAEIAARYAARLGGKKPVKPATVRKWIRKGRLRADGTTIRLGADQVGREYRVEQEALDRFMEDLRQPVKPSGGATSPKDAPGPTVPSASPAAPALKSVVGKNPAEVIALYRQQFANAR